MLFQKNTSEFLKNAMGPNNSFTFLANLKSFYVLSTLVLDLDIDLSTSFTRITYHLLIVFKSQ